MCLCVYSWEFHLVFTHFSFVNIKNCSHFHSRSQLLVPFHRFYVCVCVWVGAASRRRLLGRPLFCLFVFTPLTFTLYFLCIIFTPTYNHLLRFLRFLFLVNRSMPSMILETQFSTCQQLFCFYSAFFRAPLLFHFFKCERD